MSTGDGVLPKGWEAVHLGDVVTQRRERVSPQDHPETALIGLEHVEPHSTRLLGYWHGKDARSSVGRFFSGDVIYSRLRPYLNKVLAPPFDGLCSAEFIVLEPSDAITTDYLCVRLNALDFVSFTGRFDAGDRPRVKYDQIATFEFGLPPLNEQRRIVSTVRRHLTRVEEGTRDIAAAEGRLRTFRNAALVAAITGRLPAGDATHSAESLLAEVLEKRQSRWTATAMGRCSEPEQPRPPALPLPDGWTWATVDQLAIGIQYGSSAKTSDQHQGVPVLRMGNIVDGRLDFTDLKYLPEVHDEFPALLLQDGDLLFNRTNSPELVGKTAVARRFPEKCSFASYLIRVRLAPEIAPEWVNYFLNSPFGRQWVRDNVSQQVGQANVNGTKLRALTLPLPPLEVQHALVAGVERLIAREVELGASLCVATAQAERLRRSLLHHAVTGQLVEHASSDEPVRAVLERVEAKRASRAAERRRARKASRVPVGR